MEFKGTEGKWIVRFMVGKDDGECDFFIHAPNKVLSYGTEIMMEDFGDHNGYPRKQKMADANLIAAAPELLEALQQSQKYLVELGTKESGLAYHSNMQAINKALNK